MKFKKLFGGFFGRSAGKARRGSRGDSRQSARSRFRPLLETLEARVTPSVTLLTDQHSYLPGDTVVINGSGFAVGETVDLNMARTDGVAIVAPGVSHWQVTDGGSGDLDGVADGNIQTSWYVDDQFLGTTLNLTATGLTSGLSGQTTFSDGSADLDQWANIDV